MNTTLITGAKVLTSEVTWASSDLELRDGEIAKILPRTADTKATGSPGTTVIDARGRYVIPGLIDAHAHLTLSEDSPRDEAPGTRLLKGARNALANLRRGITTVRDAGSEGTLNLELARAIADGVVSGPKLIASGTFLAITGGHVSYWAREADGEAEVRKAVREQLKAGARYVKLMASGGVADAHENPEASQFTPSELAAAVDEAHRAGVHVAAHAHPARAIRDCLLAGVDTIEHATYLSDEVIDLLLTRDAAIVPTFAVYHRIAANERLSPAQRELSQRLWDVKAERFAAAVRAGVRWGIGTDAGSYQPPGLVADEIRHVIAAGVTPREALLAATAVNAEIVRASNTGRIAEGCSADLVFLDGDPLLDTAVLDRPTAVFVNGSLAHGQAIAA